MKEATLKKWSGRTAILAWGIFILTWYFGGAFINAVNGPFMGGPDHPPTSEIGFAIISDIQGFAKLAGYISVAVYAYTSIMSKAISRTVTVSGDNYGTINLGDVQGSIISIAQVLAGRGSQQKQVAAAIEQLADAIAKSSLKDIAKQEALDVVKEIATQAEKPPKQRSSGVLKGMLGVLPTLIKGAKTAQDLWEKYSPLIKEHLGFE